MPYEFTMDDFNKFTSEVVDAKGDQAIISTLFADMQTTLVEAIGKQLKLEEEGKTFREENERLKNANMDLMMRLGEKAMSDTASKDTDKEEDIPRGENVDRYLEKMFEED